MSKSKSSRNKRRSTVSNNNNNNADDTRITNPADQHVAEHVIIRVVKPFSKRGAYCYIPNKWLNRQVRIELIPKNEETQL